MAKVISLVNQKGGVGKTTSSINLASALGKKNKKTLLVDFDPQGNASTGLGLTTSDFANDIYDVLTGACEIKDAIIKTKFKNLSIIPSTINLVGVDVEFTKKMLEAPTFKQNNQLKEKLEEVKDDYDYIIIDCQPSLGIITMNALVASNSIIIPVQCEYFALEGITQLLNSVILVQTNLNPDLRIEGVLLTMLDSRTIMGLSVIEEVRKYFKSKVFDTIIPRLVAYVEATSYGKPIDEYDPPKDPKKKAALAYANLAKEVIDRNGN
ncbi:MAG: ParA family protein [Firmicutes bacterium]|nr:ParA family protein [Bacillota bacterium]